MTTLAASSSSGTGTLNNATGMSFLYAEGDGNLSAGHAQFPPNISQYEDLIFTNKTEGGAEVLPLYGQVILIIMYSTISLVSIGGNLIVCYIVLAYQRMRTVTNYFIVNLACSDMMMAVLCVPFTFIANLLMQYWPFPSFMCPIVMYFQAVAVFLVAFTLVAISLDRCRAILFPLRPRMTTKQAFAVIVVIWVLSLAVPLPVAIVSKVVQAPDVHGVTRDYCMEIWPDSPNSTMRYIFSLIIMVLQYFLPLLVLILTYTIIAVVIWVKKPPGESENNRDQRMAASKRKMIKMMITVVIVYALCWLPLHTITIVGDIHGEIWEFRYIQIIWYACHWLAMSNCCYNPLVYCWMNSKFRNGFKHVLRWCPCVNNQTDEYAPQSMSRIHTYVSTVKTTVDTRARASCNVTNSPYAARRNGGSPTAAKKKERIQLHNFSNGHSNGNMRYPKGYIPVRDPESE